MSTPQRLPIVNSDDGTWGDIIRQFLKKEHYDDGTDNAVNGGHQAVTIRPGTTSAAPLTFNQTGASLLTTPADGAVEYASSAFYITTGSTRKRVAIYDDASGAAGDLYYRDGSGNFVRLAMSATANQVLKSGTTPAWGATNSGFASGTASTATTYTVGTSDTVVFADATSANITISLPSALTFNGYRFYVKRTDSSGTNTVTISRSGSDTIDGVASVTLNTQYMAIGLVSNGSNWYIL
jgi:hypothetical protein